MPEFIVRGWPRGAPAAFAAMPEADERITEHTYTRKVSGRDAYAAIAGTAQAKHDRLIALCTKGDEPE